MAIDDVNVFCAFDELYLKMYFEWCILPNDVLSLAFFALNFIPSHKNLEGGKCSWQD